MSALSAFFKSLTPSRVVSLAVAVPTVTNGVLAALGQAHVAVPAPVTSGLVLTTALCSDLAGPLAALLTGKPASALAAALPVAEALDPALAADAAKAAPVAAAASADAGVAAAVVAAVDPKESAAAAKVAGEVSGAALAVAAAAAPVK